MNHSIWPSSNVFYPPIQIFWNKFLVADFLYLQLLNPLLEITIAAFSQLEATIEKLSWALCSDLPLRGLGQMSADDLNLQTLRVRLPHLLFIRWFDSLW